MSMGGKGDKRIDRQVSRKQFSDNWDLAFPLKNGKVKDKDKKKE